MIKTQLYGARSLWQALIGVGVAIGAIGIIVGIVLYRKGSRSTKGMAVVCAVTLCCCVLYSIAQEAHGCCALCTNVLLWLLRSLTPFHSYSIDIKSVTPSEDLHRKEEDESLIYYFLCQIVL